MVPLDAGDKMQNPQPCLSHTSASSVSGWHHSGGEEGPAVHTQRWLGMTIPSKDVRNFSHAGGASWNQVAGMRCPTGKTQPYNRNQRPEVRSLAGELGRTPHSLLFVSLINAWKLPPCFELEHFGSDKKFVYNPADGSLRKSFRIFFDSIIKTRWVFFTLK